MRECRGAGLLMAENSALTVCRAATILLLPCIFGGEIAPTPYSWFLSLCRESAIVTHGEFWVVTGKEAANSADWPMVSGPEGMQGAKGERKRKGSAAAVTRDRRRGERRQGGR